MLNNQNHFVKLITCMFVSTIFSTSCIAQTPKYQASATLGMGDDRKMFLFNKVVSCSEPIEKSGEFEAAIAINGDTPFPKLSITGSLKNANVIVDINETVSYRYKGKIRWYDGQGFSFLRNLEHWENGILQGKISSMVSLNCPNGEKPLLKQSNNSDGLDSSGQVSKEKLKEVGSKVEKEIQSNINNSSLKKTSAVKSYASFFTSTPKMKSYHLQTFAECKNPTVDDNTISIDVSAKYDEAYMKITGTLEAAIFDISLGEGKVFNGKGKLLKSKNNDHSFYLSLQPAKGSKATKAKTFTGGFACPQ